MLLRHLHLPGYIAYSRASLIQDQLVSRFLAHKANPKITAPQPTIITTEFEPVYTCGRREIGTVSAEQQAFLTQDTPWGQATFHEALRGGQTTFHGPGQLTAYPIMDLRRHSLSPRCYIHGLEDAVMEMCRHFGIATQRTENPGVWTDSQNKICAVGVHLRRHVSSHGIGLNVSTELGWFRRIVACGLEGKGTTSFEQQGVKVGSVEEVGDVFVRILAERLVKGVDAVVKIEEKDLDQE